MMTKEREKEMESEVQENRYHRHAFEDEEPFCHFCMLREALADRDELKARVVALDYFVKGYRESHGCEKQDMCELCKGVDKYLARATVNPGERK